MMTRARLSDLLAALSHFLYILSLLLPAIRPDQGPEFWTGLECLIYAFPFGFLFHPAPWANLTFAVGACVLARGYSIPAAVMAVISMLLAGSIVLPEVTLLPGYWMWMGAMGTQLIAAAIYPIPDGPGRQAGMPANRTE